MRQLAEVTSEESVEQKLNQLQVSFVAKVSHEFRTPLTIILLSAQLLELHSQECTPEEKLKYVRQIQDAARKMNELFDGVLEDYREGYKDLALPDPSSLATKI